MMHAELDLSSFQFGGGELGQAIRKPTRYSTRDNNNGNNNNNNNSNDNNNNNNPAPRVSYRKIIDPSERWGRVLQQR